MIKTQQELDKEINLLQERLEELKNIKIEEKKNNKRVAKGYAYYNVDSYGNVEKLNDRYDEGDNFRFYSGNYHFTEEEAEKALEKQLAFNRIMKYIHDNDLYFEPDWNNNIDRKWFIVKGHTGYISNSRQSYFKTVCVNSEDDGLKLPYFGTQLEAQHVIFNCSKDLEIYFN